MLYLEHRSIATLASDPKVRAKSLFRQKSFQNAGTRIPTYAVTISMERANENTHSCHGFEFSFGAAL